jgi:predicted MFS family arabinose efflux permease
MTAPATGERLLTPAFGALFAASLAFFVAVSLILPVASPFATTRLGTDAAGAGLAIGAYALAALAMRPVVGWASDRFGRRPLLILGSVMAIGALAAHLLVTSLPAFIGVRSVLGIADAFFFVAVLAAGSDLAPAERRGEAINLVSLSLYLGIAVGPPVGEAVQGFAGFEAVWALAALAAAVAAVLSMFVPESAPNVLRPAEERTRGRFIHPAAVFPGFLILTGAAGMSVFLAFLPLYAKDLGMAGAGVPFAIYALLVVVLRIRFAKLPDTMGASRLSGAALAVGAVGLAIFGLVPSPAGVIAGTLVFALGVTFMFPALIALAVSRVAETERGSAVGTASAFFDVAFGLGPAVFGVLATVIGFGGTFLVSATISAFGAVLLVARRAAVDAPVAARVSGGGA